MLDYGSSRRLELTGRGQALQIAVEGVRFRMLSFFSNWRRRNRARKISACMKGSLLVIAQQMRKESLNHLAADSHSRGLI